VTALPASVLALADVVSGVASGGLLAEDTNNFGDTRGGAVAGPLGLFLIVALGIATWLLIRNMTKRLRRLPSEFPGQDRGPTRGPEGNATPGPAGGAPGSRDDGAGAGGEPPGPR